MNARFFLSFGDSLFRHCTIKILAAQILTATSLQNPESAIFAVVRCGCSNAAIDTNMHQMETSNDITTSDRFISYCYIYNNVPLFSLSFSLFLLLFYSIKSYHKPKYTY